METHGGPKEIKGRTFLELKKKYIYIYVYIWGNFLSITLYIHLYVY